MRKLIGLGTALGGLGLAGALCLGCWIPVTAGIFGGAMFLKARPLILAFSVAAIATTLFSRRRDTAACGCEAGTKSSAPVACDLTVFDPEERKAHAALLKKLLSRAQTREVRGTKRAVKLPYERELFVDAAVWIADESRCCPFFGFNLRVDPAAEAFWLEIDAPPEAQGIIDTGLATASGRTT
jgi:hypothetical protein